MRSRRRIVAILSQPVRRGRHADVVLDWRRLIESTQEAAMVLFSDTSAAA